MNIIYVVTSGIYSDYAIDAVFDNYEAAHQATIDAGYECRIEEYQLNKPPNVNRVVWLVTYCPETDSWSADSWEYWPSDYNHDEVRLEKVTRQWNWNSAEVADRNFYYTYVRTDSHEAALKIGTERIMMVIAKEK